MRGTRVQNIVREISNERIDIVQWTDDMALYIRRALSPADIRKMVEVKGTNRIILVINDEDLSQAIGRNGQNVRLASQLVGRNLEIIGESDYMACSEEERHHMAQPRSDDQILEAAPQRGREGLDALFGEPKEETEEQSDAL
jgi:N utilization substance protein A